MLVGAQYEIAELKTRKTEGLSQETLCYAFEALLKTWKFCCQKTSYFTDPALITPSLRNVKCHKYHTILIRLF